MQTTNLAYGARWRCLALDITLSLIQMFLTAA